MERQDRAEFIAQQVTKALEATATVIQISQALLTQLADNAATVARLDAMYTEARRTIEELERAVFRGTGDTGGILGRIASLEHARTQLEQEINRVERTFGTEIGEIQNGQKAAEAAARAAEQAARQTDRAGWWSMKVAIVGGLFLLVGTGLGVLITWLLGGFK